ncbi:MAG: hydrogenase expression/formation protein HypE [Desulfurococcaceae archaeon]
MRAVELVHGAGGPEMIELIEKVIVSRVPPSLRSSLGGVGLEALDDGSYMRIGGSYVVVTSDSYTVKPPFFPGGNIGSLAASGVINDLVVMGARPVAFLDNIVVEEGFPLGELEEVVGSMVDVLRREGVALIGGDFKVMPRGSVDGIVISGTGIGISDVEPIVDAPRPGDALVVTGPVAEHGAVILAAQLGMLEEAKGLASDARPLTNLLPVLRKYRAHVSAARDPTRGGLAAVLNEWARGSNVTLVVDRRSIPVREEVAQFLDALGVDPLNVASEGVAVISVSSEVAEEFVGELRKAGEPAATVIGRVEEGSGPLRGRVVALTEVGGRTLVVPNPLNLPRIC